MIEMKGWPGLIFYLRYNFFQLAVTNEVFFSGEIVVLLVVRRRKAMIFQ